MKKMELGKTRGYPFCLAFVYAKSGTVLLTGTNDHVSDFLRDVEPCLVVKRFYNRGHVRTTAVSITGRNNNLFIERIDDMILNRRKTRSMSSYEMSIEDRMKIKQRRTWVLYRYEQHGNNGVKKVIKTFRQLPKSYIKELDVK